MDENVKGIAGTTGIGADQAGVISLGDGGLQMVGLKMEFTANINIGRRRRGL